MKVSILSMQRIINCGSFLQAYALKTILENMGFGVEFIDIKEGEYREEKSIQNSSYLQKISKYISKNFWKKLEFKSKSSNLESKIKHAQYKYLGISEEYNYVPNDDSQAVIIGSDEVFNFNPKSDWGVSSQLFGNIDNPKVISYAASCGFMTYSDLPSCCTKLIQDSLQKMKGISVRDTNTYEFVKNFTSEEVRYNLDPVLVYSFKKELEELNTPKILKQKYMIIYSYYERISDVDTINIIKTYAKNKGLKIFCVGAALSWCDDFPVLSPFETLLAFKNAKCIVTDTFHGAIMSAKYNKKFACIVRESNKNKLEDLLKRLHLENQIVEYPQEIIEKLTEDINYDYFNKLIEKEEINTKEYLEHILKEN